MSTIEIPLTRGKAALIDKVDFDLICSCGKWNAFTPREGGQWYATTGGKANGKRATLYMHRVIMDAPPGVQVDHCNMDGLDNRRSNLRLCTASENHANTRGIVNATSRFKGVYLIRSSGKWCAMIKHNQRARHLGNFDSERVAAFAYNEAAVELFGEFARLNNLET